MSRESFEYWKELVGLERYTFPYLIPLNTDNIQLARIAQRRIQDIQQRLGTAKQVAVQVQPGWGATTLYHYMGWKLRDDAMKLLVRFDFEADGLKEEDLTEEEFIFQIKWRLASGILNIMLNKAFPEYYMYHVFQFEDTGAKPWRGYLREKRMELFACAYDRKLFYPKFPFFEEMDIADCLNYFLRNFQMQTVFMYLFPRNMDEDVLMDFTGIIKNIFDGKDIDQAASREIFFVTPQVFNTVKSAYERPYSVVSYNQYSPAEIFSMLVNTYKLQDFSNSTISDVFDQEFITKVHDKTLTLNEIMEKVEEKIVDFLDDDINKVPYKLRLNKTDGDDDDDYE